MMEGRKIKCCTTRPRKDHPGPGWYQRPDLRSMSGLCHFFGGQILPLGYVEQGKEERRHRDRHRTPRTAPRRPAPGGLSVETERVSIRVASGQTSLSVRFTLRLPRHATQQTPDAVTFYGRAPLLKLAP